MGGEFRWEGGQLGGKRAEEEEERQRKRREAEEESLAERQELMTFFGSRGKRGKIDNGQKAHRYWEKTAVEGVQ